MSTNESMPATSENTAPLRERSAAFVDYLDSFLASLPPVPLGTLLENAGGADKVAVIAVDVVNGFCVEGPLASARVGAIVPPIARLLRATHAAGVRAFVVLRDSHASHAPEFEQFGPHCLAGTVQSRLVRELAELPFAGSFADIPKNATSAWAGAGEGAEPAAERLEQWVARQEEAGVNTFIVVGDCTDLCVYQTAMPLKLGANARNRSLTVLVPEDCVDTYDLPVDIATKVGATPHDAGLLHAVFLYHLALNGVQVVGAITAPILE
ncbi:MAG: Nicotinamidase [uncultured Chloroflexi bacterium]|uniref:Nicotinamidase n=1 Tax=uncultured Chloroflexota bacterium TaxID=166587 RepID=A0A6J4K0Y1_9CHLR|nr:MAG: Nicotinamidase [uncultured Chloroflexota bacterium]